MPNRLILIKEGETIMKLYVTYEDTGWNEQGQRLVLDENGMKKLYLKTVNKEDYDHFSDWLNDMLRSGVFEEITNTYQVIGRNKNEREDDTLIEYFDTEKEAENFCENWGWSYSDDTGDYWLQIVEPE